MAHVFFETGDHSGGAEFLESWLPGFPRQAQIYSHLTWHLALCELAGGRPERVLALYDQTLHPEVSPGAPLIALCDAAALLWRYDLYGLERPTASPGGPPGVIRDGCSRPSPCSRRQCRKWCTLLSHYQTRSPGTLSGVLLTRWMRGCA